MSLLRRLIIAVLVFVFVTFAWVGAEFLIEGKVQQSIIDTIVAVLIALFISGKFEKGVEEHERREKLAEKFAEGFVEHIKEREKTKNGENGSGQCIKTGKNCNTNKDK